ncbi:MAG: glycosyltransferase [Akkermansia sp.]
MSIYSALITHRTEPPKACESLANILSRIPELIPQTWVQQRVFPTEEELPPSPWRNSLLLHLLGEPASEGMSLPFARRSRVAEHWSELDILHLHALHGDSVSLHSLSRLQQPILYEVHDESGLSALCQHSGKCKQYLWHCRHCPRCRFPSLVERIFRYKQAQFAALHRLILITPSHKRQHEVRRSPMFAGREVRHIGIALDCEQLHAHHRIDCKEERDIHPHQRVIAFRCSGDAKDWKEHEEPIIQALCHQLHEAGYLALHIIILGQNACPALPYPCHSYSPTKDSAKARARLYSSIDILIQLSEREEDERHALEAMACQVPIITHRRGNMSEYVENKERGISMSGKPELNIEVLLAHLKTLLHAPMLRSHYGLKARQYIEQEHEISFITALYRQLYHELTEGTNQDACATAGRADA